MAIRTACMTVPVMVCLTVVVWAAEATPPLAVYEAKSVSTAPKVDGSLEDACWQNAEKMTGFTQVIKGEGPARYATEAMACYNTHNLYLGIVCTETEPLATLLASHTEHDSDVWADDGVEIFIDPGRSLRTYYQLCVNSRAARYDAKGMDKTWDAKWETGAQLGEGQYTIECAIAFENFGATPRGGDVWGLNLCRDHNANGKEEWSCWSNTLGGFHTPTRFGLLVFGSCRAALALFVKENDAGMTRALDRTTKLAGAKGSETERTSLAAIRQVVERIRGAAKLQTPLPAPEWSEMLEEWRSALNSLDDLELDVRFRLLLED